MVLDICRSNVFSLFLGIVFCILSTGYCQITIENCPGDQTLTQHRAYWEPPTVDGNGATFTLTTTHTPGSIFPDGINMVEYSAEGENGVADTCMFRIIINNDNAPTITGCPSTVHETAASGAETATATWNEPTAANSSGSNVPWTYRTRAPGDTFRVGTTTVFYEFVDSDDNGALCEFTVNVSAVFDNDAPTVVCPGDQVLEIPENETETTVTWITPIPSGNYETLISTHDSGDSFGEGTTTVTYIVRDEAGNSNQCTFSIMVIVIVPDRTAPTFTYCPADINRIVGPDVIGTYAVTWDMPTANDSVSDASDIEITFNVNSGYAFSVDTSTEVIYRATDEAGNEATCKFNVVVSVDGVPTFNSCPVNKEVEMTGPSTAATWTEPVVSDDSTVTSNYDPGDTFTGPATYTVIYMAIDPFGSTAECRFDVIIQDTTAPVVNGCPGDIQRTVSNKNTVTISWNEPTAEDNSGMVTLTNDVSPGSTFTTGETTSVTYTATDASSGKSAICRFTVTVEGTTVCDDNPCENGGACVTDGEDSFACICVDDYKGDKCTEKGLSTLLIVAIILGSVAGVLILALLIFCCCYYCCFAVVGEEERPHEIVVHKEPLPPKHVHMGVGFLPEPKPSPVSDNRPLGARFHNDPVPERSSGRRKSGRRFRHKNFISSKTKDATSGNYDRQHDSF
ncbi:hyalin-like [Anneissia japonica]|uniref:hyalin-like n=1 Tax=Anneissia japonica TaxID=1529436 RepID=UPI00142564F0|nr:hyalin-like [Anneissia japonica]